MQARIQCHPSTLDVGPVCWSMMNKGRSNSASSQDSEAMAAQSPAKPRRRKRRFWRLALGAMLILILLIAAGLWTVTRSWFIIGQLTPELERKLGGKVTIGNAVYQGDGRIV